MQINYIEDISTVDCFVRFGATMMMMWQMQLETGDLNNISDGLLQDDVSEDITCPMECTVLDG